MNCIHCGEEVMQGEPRIFSYTNGLVAHGECAMRNARRYRKRGPHRKTVQLLCTRLG